MPENYCFSPGETPSDSVCVTATAGECYDVWGVLSSTTQTGISEEGCGRDLAEARSRAIAELALSVSLTTEEEQAVGHCLFEVD